MSLDAGSIAGICTAVTALVGAITTFIYKVRGRSCREVLKELINNKTEETKELNEVIKTQASVLKDIVTKEVQKEKKKK